MDEIVQGVDDFKKEIVRGNTFSLEIVQGGTFLYL